jgi:hypothetical protein
MSRYYEMHVRIEGFDQDRLDEIEGACNDAWAFEEEPWCEHSDSDGEEIIAVELKGKDHLGGGEDDDEFALRLTQDIWRANRGFCRVEVTSYFLEGLPTDVYEFDKAKYDEWADMMKATGLDGEDE